MKRIYIVTKKYIPLEKIHTSIQMQLQTKEERRTGVQNFINSSSLPVTQAQFFSKAPLKEENLTTKSLPIQSRDDQQIFCTSLQYRYQFTSVFHKLLCKMQP